MVGILSAKAYSHVFHKDVTIEKGIKKAEWVLLQPFDPTQDDLAIGTVLASFSTFISSPHVRFINFISVLSLLLRCQTIATLTYVFFTCSCIVCLLCQICDLIISPNAQTTATPPVHVPSVRAKRGPRQTHHNAATPSETSAQSAQLPAQVEGAPGVDNATTAQEPENVCEERERKSLPFTSFCHIPSYSLFLIYIHA